MRISIHAGDNSRSSKMFRGFLKFFPLLFLPVIAMITPGAKVFAQKDIHVKGRDRK